MTKCKKIPVTQDKKEEKNEIAMEAIEQFSKLYKENLEKRRRKN